MAKKNEKEHIILNLFVWRVKRLLISTVQYFNTVSWRRTAYLQLAAILLMFIRIY